MPKAIRADLDARLLKLVGNPLPNDAIPTNANPARYRIQVNSLTIGYEYDSDKDEVVVKAVLHDEDTNGMSQAEINKWLEKIMKRG